MVNAEQGTEEKEVKMEHLIRLVCIALGALGISFGIVLAGDNPFFLLLLPVGIYCAGRAFAGGGGMDVLNRH